MKQPRVLVIDDDLGVRRVVADILRSQGARVFLAGDGREGLELLRRQPVDVIFVDLRLPDDNGISVVQQARYICPGAGLVIVTGYPSFESSVLALQKGVCDYVTKPITRQNIIAALSRATAKLTREQSDGEETKSSSSGRGGASVCQFVAASLVMRKLLTRAAQLAQTEVPVLIQGEKGTGKALLARWFHEQSRRAGGPFKHFLANATRENRLELLLSKEIQDGLSAAERGEGSLLDQACGGTLFLDEISEVPLWAQAKLFELLDGEGGAAAADVRVIASTSWDLNAAVGEGRFCRDLYYYLNVAPIRIPPLRQRPEDIRPLAAYLFGQCQDRLGPRKSADGGPLRVGDEVWQYLCRYNWPGNVGELVNFAERAVLGAKNGELTAVTVAKLIHANRLYSEQVETVTVPLGGDLKEMERHIVREMIQRCHGNKAAAARALGMHRRTLYRLLQEDDSTKQTTTALLGTQCTEVMAEA